MDFKDYENYWFVPQQGESAGELFELKESLIFQKNSLVLIPYQNPQLAKPAPKFYAVIKKTEVNDTKLSEVVALSKPLTLKAQTSKKSYIENVKKLKQEIQLGNIYEINYCVRFYAEDVDIDPLCVFLKLNTIAKAPYASLLKTGNDYIISASPELFLKKKGNTIFTKPIKGTIKRGKSQKEDEMLKEELLTNIKERTENVMAVDVARNDLSRFAKKGSVKVNKLYNIETFETVHQMVSTVSCEIKEELLNHSPEKLFETLIDATFPMASMTGAPKIRAMQLIDTFENFQRQVYSGAIGLIDENGDFILSVIIRSIFYNQRTKLLSFAVGGAITYLSEPEKEYEECLLKAGAMLKALNAIIATK